jgi:uncharacterized protein YbjT (DUF2867 family)
MIYNNDQLFCTDLPSSPLSDKGIILVTGATGYIGGRLVPELLARGYSVRVMVRVYSPEQETRWPGAEIVVADARDIHSLRLALDNVYAAYYLIHSLLLGKMKFGSIDLTVAQNFRKAAEEKIVSRIIYLCGLGNVNSKLSQHLNSRLKVAEELSKGAFITTVIRAAIIIGSGSASYEILKDLSNNLPIILAPNWAKTICQPIAIRDVLKYLVGVLEHEDPANHYYDIGGKDILSYEDMMRIMVFMLGRKKLLISVPISNTYFFGYLASFFTSVPTPITKCLFEGCKNEVVCNDRSIMKIVDFVPLSYKEAILEAMSMEEQDKISTRWSDAYPPAHDLAIKLKELKTSPGFIIIHSRVTEKNPSSLYNTFCQIGGKQGWLKYNWLWRFRGLIDKVLLGIGSSRGRRSTKSLRINDVIDYWRVEDLRDDRLLLRAEMKLPGKAWLEITTNPDKKMTTIMVKAYFLTDSIIGKFYWYLLKPFHSFVLKDLLKQITKRSVQNSEKDIS